MLIDDPRIDRAALLRHLDEEYGFAATEIDFLPVGGDGHNYRAGGHAEPWFVSVKRGNSDPRRTERWALDFDASHRAVRRLVDEGGLEFLSAAWPRKDGRVTGSFAGRPAVVQPWLEGETRPHTPDARQIMYTRIQRLHAATEQFGDLGLPHETFESDFESTLDQALQLGTEPGRQVGPYSVWLREAVLPKLKAIAETRERFHAARDRVLARGTAGWVITHGEPHGANVVWTAAGPVLVDCGEMFFAPPERDLGGLEMTGDPEISKLYGRWWVLSEIAEYTDRLSRPHVDDAEDRRARDQLIQWLGWTG